MSKTTGLESDSTAGLTLLDTCKNAKCKYIHKIVPEAKRVYMYEGPVKGDFNGRDSERRQRASKRVAVRKVHGKARVGKTEKEIHKREQKDCYLDQKKLVRMARLWARQADYSPRRQLSL